MKQGYMACVEERGTGSFMRMKSHMANHVEKVLVSEHLVLNAFHS